MREKPRILIFVVAYEAQATLEKVLNRIPEDVFHYDTEILVIDDSSQDKTFEVGVKYCESKNKYTITILYNEENQGEARPHFPVTTGKRICLFLKT